MRSPPSEGGRFSGSGAEHRQAQIRTFVPVCIACQSYCEFLTTRLRNVNAYKNSPMNQNIFLRQDHIQTREIWIIKSNVDSLLFS
jgi:hypothetical protein